MSKPTILFYDPAGESWGHKLRQLCAVQGFRLRPLGPSDLGRSISSLASGLRPAGEIPQVSPVEEPILLFCWLSGSQLDRALQSLHRIGVPRSCLKAVLTSNNAQWSLRALYDELCRERAQLP